MAAKNQKHMTSTEMIAKEVADSEKSLEAIGKFGILMMVLALVALAVLLYKIGSMVSPATPGEMKLAFACIILIALAFMAGHRFSAIADYRWAIHEWREQSIKDYQERHREVKK